jgi:nucleoside-diphosphate-sugar epimerase
MPEGPILVTGGLGFLGSHLASRLVEAGETVRILARPRPGPEAQDGRYELIWGDIRDAAVVDGAVRGCKVVMHLASNFRHRASDEKEAFAINVEGTRNVIESCIRHGVRQLINCSTFGVHGNVLEIPANEESPFNPLDLYQETKLVAEQESLQAYRERGLPVTVVRPGSMYGPGDRRLLKLFRMIQKRRFVMVGDGETFFHPAYVDDVVDVFMRCLGNEKTVGETFIAAGDEYLALNKLVGIIAEELRVPPPRLRVPQRPILALASLCEWICVPLGIEPPLHHRRVSFFTSNRAFSVAKARKLLGFQPRVGFREGVGATIGWYRQQGWLQRA